MRWGLDDIAFDIVAEDTDHPIVTVSFKTPSCEIRMMAELEERGRTLRLIDVHIQGASANPVGIANLRMLADVVMQRMDYSVIEIEGAVRTTGTGPGRRPGRLRFTRRPDPSADR